ncbi:hypothetical protein [Clavibacter capsici]|uniref:Uncharacterized protein n=1 Tax=Clavibacter capsici TaxID=1874630 RepID=A0AAE6XT31_9MICO|nr:hypothetical protein [Clavibacter capsici]ALD14383.1 hypothetical protein AES38_14900 [Clavibacter capsici]QIS40509.1 hypothetical protein GW572_15070 [Clavibacter capsici]QIS46503.1 hypothetical protein GW570_15080 [Clavibacter capsici]
MRTTMHVGDQSYTLARGQDTVAVTDATIGAARAGAGLVAVTVTVYGNRAVEILITSAVPVSFETGRAASNDRDDGDLDTPFDTHEQHAHVIPETFDDHFAVSFDDWDL